MRAVVKGGFSPIEVAQMLGVSHATIYREMNRGRLSSIKIGSRRVITKWDLEEYLGKERANALIENIAEEVFPNNSEIMEEERLKRIDKAMGMFAHLPGSVDEFIKRKHEDIDIENRFFDKKG